ncbi:MAG: preprotein translocase subunit SecG [Verrucomicrobiota bacterium]|nr:preprotein translocase subunit SecG [Verrucomicrobiota bacterium]
MSFLIGFLTFLLVVNCLFLILLVLVQLPKKEAGAGIAFGAGTTEAIFGAGSGNALTKMTKYGSVSFLVLSLVIGLMNMNQTQASRRNIEEALSKQANAPAPAIPAATPANRPATNQFFPLQTAQSNVTLTLPAATNVPAGQTATNAPK